MARDGSGTYNRAQSDYIFDTVIDETAVNAEMDDIATALSASLAKDGQTNPTANLPMATFRHTGVGNASARTDYAAAGQVTDGALTYAGVAGGTADALTVTLAPAVTALVTGMRFLFKAGAANNTGAATIAVNGLTPVALEINDAALGANDIVANKWYLGIYDGTALQISRLASAASSADMVSTNNLSDVANAATARTNLGLAIGTDVQADLDVPSQAEAEAGVATTERVWTAERVGQAISALATSGPTQATQAAIEAETNEDTYIPPDLIKHSPGHPKAWCYVTVSGGNPTLTANYGVATIDDDGVGDFGINFDTAFSSANYAMVGVASYGSSGAGWLVDDSKTTGAQETRTRNSADSLTDPALFSASFYGDFA